MIGDEGRREEESRIEPEHAGARHEGGRDPRLVTRRRGGLLEDGTHHALALWAAACAENVLALFETRYPDDPRPRAAVEAARTWAREQITMTEARQAAYASHAAARESSGAAAAAARSAAHAAATAHMADHELAAAAYALRGVALVTGDPAVLTRERRWQVDHLPDDVRDLVLDDMDRRGWKFGKVFDL